MNRTEIDELYHLLRYVSNEAANNKSPEIASIIYGMSKHLLAGGDYLSLVQYCAYYGENYLLEPTFTSIHSKNWKPKRIVELGAGLGWLGRGLAVRFDLIPTLFVDKRQWAMIDLVADLETSAGLLKVQECLREGDLIVMSDFLHCVENPMSILTAFSKYPIAILEYLPSDFRYSSSYKEQLGRYGGNPQSTEELIVGLSGRLDRKVATRSIGPYVLTLIDKEV